jgi:hypothetical protein
MYLFRVLFFLRRPDFSLLYAFLTRVHATQEQLVIFQPLKINLQGPRSTLVMSCLTMDLTPDSHW